MIRKRRPRSSSLFLMELILSILFFSAASAACIQIFVKSHLISRDAEALNKAVLLCSNQAELLSALPDLEEGETELYYDSQFASCPENQASYVLTTTIKLQDFNAAACIKLYPISDQEKPIFQLETIHHIARRTGHETE